MLLDYVILWLWAQGRMIWPTNRFKVLPGIDATHKKVKCFAQTCQSLISAKHIVSFCRNLSWPPSRKPSWNLPEVDLSSNFRFGSWKISWAWNARWASQIRFHSISFLTRFRFNPIMFYKCKLQSTFDIQKLNAVMIFPQGASHGRGIIPLQQQIRLLLVPQPGCGASQG